MTFEIFKAENKMMYTETGKCCFDFLGHWVSANYAIRVESLAEFLAMLDDDEIVLSPDCPERHPIEIPLKPSRKVSEVDSLVVFDTWCEGQTPAIALYERRDDGKLTFVRTYPMAEDIPQRFWEIRYPSACVRITAKVRRYFQFDLDSSSPWYFVGKNTKALYTVSHDDPRVMVYADACSTTKTDGEKVRKTGVSDGLDSNCFRETNRFCGFDIKALTGTDYWQYKLDTPEDMMGLVHDNADIESELRKILTEDELKLL